MRRIYGQQSRESARVAAAAPSRTGKGRKKVAYEDYAFLRMPLACCALQGRTMDLSAIEDGRRGISACRGLQEHIIVFFEQRVHDTSELPGYTANDFIFPYIVGFRRVVAAKSGQQVLIHASPLSILTDGCAGGEPKCVFHEAVATPGLAIRVQRGAALLFARRPPKVPTQVSLRCKVGNASNIGDDFCCVDWANAIDAGQYLALTRVCENGCDLSIQILQMPTQHPQFCNQLPLLKAETTQTRLVSTPNRRCCQFLQMDQIRGRRASPCAARFERIKVRLCYGLGCQEALAHIERGFDVRIDEHFRELGKDLIEDRGQLVLAPGSFLAQNKLTSILD